MSCGLTKHFFGRQLDQQGFELPPAVCQRWQDQRHTNWASKTAAFNDDQQPKKQHKWTNETDALDDGKKVMLVLQSSLQFTFPTNAHLVIIEGSGVSTQPLYVLLRKKRETQTTAISHTS